MKGKKTDKKRDLDITSTEGSELLVALVVIDDGFLSPTSTIPTCLLNVGGNPILHYTLTNLTHPKYGVDEIYVYITRRSEEVASFLNRRNWIGTTKHRVNITPIYNENVSSLGDVMRDVDQRALITRQNFALIHGDTLISNVDFRHSLFPKFAETKYVDKNAVLSQLLAYTPSIPSNFSRFCGKTTQLVTAQTTDSNRILHYYVKRSKTESNIISSPNLKISRTAFEIARHLGQDLQICTYSCDFNPHVFICAPAVLCLFSDHFDILNMTSFVTEVIENDLLDFTVYATAATQVCINYNHMTTTPYARRLTCPEIYLTTQRDAICRVMHPTAVERTSPIEVSLTDALHCVYAAPSANISHSSTYLDNVVVCKNSWISKSCTLNNVFVGESCKIEDHVTLENVYLTANVTVKSGCKLTNCIVLCSNVILDANLTLHRALIDSEPPSGTDGSFIIPHGVYDTGITMLVKVGNTLKVERADWLGASCGISSRSRDVLASGAEDSSSSDDSTDTDSSDEEGDLSSSENTDATDSTEDEVEEDLEIESVRDGLKNLKTPSQGECQNLEIFQSEVEESLSRGLEMSIDIDNLTLEINSSRHAYAVSASQVIFSIVDSIFNMADTKSSFLSSFKSLVFKFKRLLLKYCTKNETSQIHTLNALSFAFSAPKNVSLTCFAPKVLHLLYEFDVLEEDSILKWFGQDESNEDHEKISEFKIHVKSFVDWLSKDDSSGEDADSE